MKLRAQATLFHLVGTALVAVIAGWLVFRLWYPPPLSLLAGGATLFMLLVVVDLVLGPLLTAVVANPQKRRDELWRDIGVIVTLQVAALAYGLHTVAAARPAVLAFEVDLFRLVSANDVEHEQLRQAPAALQTLSWSGPRTLAAVKPASEQEQYETIQLGLAGIHLAALPRYWRDYASEQAKAWAKATPLNAAGMPAAEHQADIQRAASAAGVAVDQLRTLPLLARHAEGTVLLAPPNARIVGLLSVPMPIPVPLPPTAPLPP